jgi:hypothetical protein
MWALLKRVMAGWNQSFQLSRKLWFHPFFHAAGAHPC